MTSLPPWTSGPFELIVHGEIHLRGYSDFDRRIALISFDNAIEVAITTYLTLNPTLRGGRTLATEKVNKWMKNYHTKLNFFEQEMKSQKITWPVAKSHIIWAHDHRNEQYHGGQKGTPEENVLQVARTAALWVFSVLFHVSDAEAVLEQAILDQALPAPPSRERRFDIAIDAQYGVMTLGEQSYYASELLFAVDHAAYRDLGGKLIDGLMRETIDELEP